MEIRSLHMYRDEIQTPPAPCSVCEEIFQPSDDLDFVCRKCQSALAGHCCEYDDVHMDWGVELEGEYPYFWIIECICGNVSKSRLHSINEQGAIAKELHTEWLLRLPTQRRADLLKAGQNLPAVSNKSIGDLPA